MEKTGKFDVSMKYA